MDMWLGLGTTLWFQSILTRLFLRSDIFLLWYYLKKRKKILGKPSCHQGILQPLHAKDHLKNSLRGTPWCCRPRREIQAAKCKIRQWLHPTQPASHPLLTQCVCRVGGWAKTVLVTHRRWCDPSLGTSKLMTFIYTHVPFAPNALTCILKTGSERVNLSSANSSQWSFPTALSHCNCWCLLTPKTRVDRLYLDLSIYYKSSEQESSSSTSQCKAMNYLNWRHT